jgi:hypothetical protein
MQRWAPIDIADALELLSPDFTNEEVCTAVFVAADVVEHAIPDCNDSMSIWLSATGARWFQVRRHAVEVLQRAEDEELCYYLLQLVQVSCAAVLGDWWILLNNLVQNCENYLNTPRIASGAALRSSRRVEAGPFSDQTSGVKPQPPTFLIHTISMAACLAFCCSTGLKHSNLSLGAPDTDS